MNVDAKKVYEGKEPYVFISYSHKDTEKVIPIIEGLQKKGFRVWYDAGIEAGSEWPEYIAEHIFSCGCVIAFVSSNYAFSKNCKQEIRFAINKNKSIIVAYLEDFELSLGMQMQLDTLQAIYYSRHDSVESFIKALAESKVIFPCKLKESIISESSETSNHNQSVADNRSEKDNGKELFFKGKEYYDSHDYEKSFELFEKAAMLGNSQAQYYLAISYTYGRGTGKSESAAIMWYKKAAMQSVAEAQKQLAYYYKYGLFVEKDIDKAIALYEKAALQGNAFSMRELAKLLSEEKKKYDEAFMWLNNCVESGGNALAMIDLANCYFKGLGTEKNYNLAFYWHCKAEEDYKNEESEMILAECYEKGLGIEKNNEKALYYYGMAAEKGNKKAQKKITKK